MSSQLTFTFEELPLLIEAGFSAGLVNGQALLNYWPDGSWGVAEIYLDGARRKSSREILQASLNKVEGFRCWEEKPVLLDRGTPLHQMIWDRLENEWREHVDDAVLDAINGDREDAAEFRAEQRMEDRRYA